MYRSHFDTLICVSWMQWPAALDTMLEVRCSNLITIDHWVLKIQSRDTRWWRCCCCCCCCCCKGTRLFRLFLKYTMKSKMDMGRFLYKRISRCNEIIKKRKKLEQNLKKMGQHFQVFWNRNSFPSFLFSLKIRFVFLVFSTQIYYFEIFNDSSAKLDDIAPLTTGYFAFELFFKMNRSEGLVRIQISP